MYRMIRIAICDDEAYFQDYLKKCLDNYMKRTSIVYEIDVYDSGNDLLKAHGNCKYYNIIYLDVQMDKYNGLETAQIIRKKNSEVQMVFVTAYISYVFDGYKVNAARYICKQSGNLEGLINESMDYMLKNINLMNMKISLNLKKYEKSILIRNIIYVETERHKLHYHVMGPCKEEEYIVYYRTKESHDELKIYGFIRIHQSYYVNISFVEDIKRYEVVLKTGSKIPISKARYKDVYMTFLRYKSDV